jgi:mycothiol synthase
VSRLDVKRELGPDDVATITALLAAAEAAEGRRPLSDHEWIDLERGGGDGFAAVLAWDGDDSGPVAYTQVSRQNESWGIELVIDPRRGRELAILGPMLLEAGLAVVASEGGGPVHWWVFEPTPDHERVAAEVGLRPGRLLHQMRRPLPTGLPVEVTTRPFRVGQDEAAWMAVNNRAFAGHPEQGGWTLATLQAREREPWFDADGFLLHERDGRLAAFCWTKIHADREPVLGEIYVIAVDPDFHGLGLGRAMTLAGLEHLAAGGVGTGMLYVDAANAAGMHLYEKLGFAVHHSDRAFVGHVDPA